MSFRCSDLTLQLSAPRFKQILNIENVSPFVLFHLLHLLHTKSLYSAVRLYRTLQLHRTVQVIADLNSKLALPVILCEMELFTLLLGRLGYIVICRFVLDNPDLPAVTAEVPAGISSLSSFLDFY